MLPCLPKMQSNKITWKLEQHTDSTHLSGRGGSLVSEAELLDERPELARGERHAEHGPIRGEYCGQLTNHSSPEHGHGLLELRGLDRAREVGQGHLLPLLASGQELLHLDYRTYKL